MATSPSPSPVATWASQRARTLAVDGCCLAPPRSRRPSRARGVVIAATSPRSTPSTSVAPERPSHAARPAAQGRPSRSAARYRASAAAARHRSARASRGTPPASGSATSTWVCRCGSSSRLTPWVNPTALRSGGSRPASAASSDEVVPRGRHGALVQLDDAARGARRLGGEEQAHGLRGGDDHVEGAGTAPGRRAEERAQGAGGLVARPAEHAAHGAVAQRVELERGVLQVVGAVARRSRGRGRSRGHRAPTVPAVIGSLGSSVVSGRSGRGPSSRPSPRRRGAALRSSTSASGPACRRSRDR